MDTIIFRELARSWLAQNEQDTCRDASDEPETREMNARMDGESAARAQCAKDLERILSIYSPLLR